MARLGKGRRRRKSDAAGDSDADLPGSHDGASTDSPLEALATWEFASAPAGAPHAGAPATADAVGGEPDVIDLTTQNPASSGAPSNDDRVAQYSAWADRMRAKRQQNKERIAEANGHVGARVQPNYWHADTIFVDGATVDESDGADRLGASELVELYSHLELGPDADLAAITEAYRRLAKRHHPDRWATADPATQAHHEQQMLAVNRAYRLLRAELDADTHR